MSENQINLEELKMQALMERIAGLTAEYENKIVDLRVAYTVVSQERDNLRAQLEEAQSAKKSSK